MADRAVGAAAVRLHVHAAVRVVRLGTDRSLADTVLQDVAFTYPARTLLDIPNRVAVVEMNQEELPGRHALQFELGLYKIIRTDNAAKIQLFIRTMDV